MNYPSRCMIGARTTCIVYAFSRTLQSGLPSIELSGSNKFYETNVAWQDHGEFLYI